MADTNLNIIIKAVNNATPVLKAIASDVETLKKAVENINVNIDFDKGFKQAAASAKKVTDEIKKTKVQQRIMVDQLDPFNSRIRLAGRNWSTVADAIGNSRGQLLAMLGVVAAVIASIKGMSNAFFEVESAIAEVKTLIGQAGISQKQLSETTRELSDEFGVAQLEVAKALYQAISSGAQAGAEANNLLRVSLALAKAGMTDVATAVDGLTTIINAFNLGFDDAGRVSDILFATMRGGKTTVQELSDRFFQIAPLAAALGVSLEEVAAGFQTLTLQGQKTNTAATQMRAALAGLARETPEVKKTFEDLGFASSQAAIQANGMQFAFEALVDAAEGNTGVLQKMVGSIEGVQAILQTTGPQVNLFRQALDEVNASAGSTEEGLGIVEATISEQVVNAVNRIKNAVISLGEGFGPAVAAITNFVANFVTGVDALLSVNSGIKQIFGVLIIAVSGLVVAFTGLIAVVGILLISGKNIAVVFGPLFNDFNIARERIDKFNNAIAKSPAALTRTGTSASRTQLRFKNLRAAMRVFNVELRTANIRLPFMKRNFGVLIPRISQFSGALQGALRVFGFLTKAFLGGIGASVLVGSILSARDAVDEFADEAKRLREEKEKLGLSLDDPLVDVKKLQQEFANAGDLTKEEADEFIRRIQEVQNLLKQEKSNLDKEAEKFLQGPVNLATGETSLAQQASSIGSFFNRLVSGRALLLTDEENTKTLDQIDKLTEGTKRLGNLIREVKDEGTINIYPGAKDDEARIKAVQDEIKRFDDSLKDALETSEKFNKLTFDQLTRNLQTAFRRAVNTAVLEGQVERAKDLQRQAIRETLALQIRQLRAQEQQELRNFRARIANEKNFVSEKEEEVAESNDRLLGLNKSLLNAQADAAREESRLTFAALQRLQQLSEAFIKQANADLKARATEIRSFQALIEEIDLAKLTDFERDEKEISDLTSKLDEFDKVRQRLIVARGEFEFVDPAQIDEVRRARSEISGLEQEVSRLSESVLEEAGDVDFSSIAFLGLESSIRDRLVNAVKFLTAEFSIAEQSIKNTTEKNKQSVDSLGLSLESVNEKVSKLTARANEVQFTHNFDDVANDIRRQVKALDSEDLSFKVTAEVRSLRDAIASGPGAEGFSSGGLVRGRGTSTSDSIPALLSDKEFVIRAAAVEKFGVEFFRRINDLDPLAIELLTHRRFASGGLVSSGPPIGKSTSADTGGTRDLVDIRLQVGDSGSVSLFGERQQAKQLAKSLRKLRSTVVGR